MQKHAARNLHYDLRLELGGVLHSWAVPKGPSLDPAVKRLAVEVEDHPIEYADFEGKIPEGNYGAGAVIVFDRGRWVPLGDPEAGLSEGKLLFDLWGYKLRGRWTLFRTKAAPNSWMLVKKPDAFARSGDELPPESILSGRTVEQVAGADDPAAAVRERLERMGAPRRRLDPRTVALMLARTADEPFSDPGWLFELKYDGFRMIAAREEGKPFLRYRGGQVATDAFPELTACLRALPYDDLVLDGELVVLDERGRPSFHGLQQRVHLTRRADVERATVEAPATLFVFDLLACEGYDVRPLPLGERRKLLDAIVPPRGPLCRADSFEQDGVRVFEEVGRLGFEGVVAKRADAPYQGGRSPAWLKIRADRAGDFAVVGFSLPKGGRSGLGALHLAVRDGAKLRYAGRVGAGFTDDQLNELRSRLEPRRRAAPACTGEAPGGTEHVWVEPELVVEVRYKEWTGAGLLRHPVFLRLREDKAVEECESPDAPAVAVEPAPAQTEEQPPAKVEPRPPAAERTVPYTNLDKVFWPDEGYTKGDLIAFYRAVARWVLPYLRDRPVVLTRYPDGIGGKSFFQKDAPGFAPEWIRTETMWSEHARREIRYFVCEDEPSLLYLANLGTIPLHLWSSRISSLQHPDWCILDLDPKQAPFEQVVHIAQAVRALCDEIGLACFVKTSGSSGLHVLVPLGRQCTYEQSRRLGEILSRVIVTEHRESATLMRSLGRRSGRVYIDYLQNGHGRLLVAPLSVRPLPGAPVSTPLRWSEVGPALRISDFTIRSVPARLARQRRDPWEGMLDLRPDLGAALARLERRL
jgi:bifunctional non-homologous end joining protein LigD